MRKCIEREKEIERESRRQSKGQREIRRVHVLPVHAIPVLKLSYEFIGSELPTCTSV